MLQIAGTFFNDEEEDFKAFVELFKEKGYQVAKQGGVMQAVVIKEVPDDNQEE